MKKEEERKKGVFQAKLNLLDVRGVLSHGKQGTNKRGTLGYR